MNSSIDETIASVESLYSSITGQKPPRVEAALTRIPPELDPVRHVEDQLAKLVSALEQKFAPSAPAWQPRTSVWQDDQSFELAIDVPGVTRDSLTVACDGQALVVRGERKAPWGDARQPLSCEAPVGAFARTFALPMYVEPGQITARLDSGVLRVRFARRVQSEPSTITVSV
jgi:HSP20 family protein